MACAAVCGRVRLCEALERVTAEAHDAPVFLGFAADAFVDGDGGGVPGEDVPFEAVAAFLYGDLGYGLEEGFAYAVAAQGGGDVDVFEADAVVA